MQHHSLQGGRGSQDSSLKCIKHNKTTESSQLTQSSHLLKAIMDNGYHEIIGPREVHALPLDVAGRT